MGPRAPRWISALAPVFFVASFVVFGATCYSPEIGDGAFACGPDGLCPQGFVCRTDVDLCFRRGETTDAGIPDLSATTPPDLADRDGGEIGDLADAASCKPYTPSFTATTPVTFTTGSGPLLIQVADLNRDHHLDLVVSTYNTNLINVLLGKGNGTFGTPTTYKIGSGAATSDDALGIAIADYNGDGLLDILATSPSTDLVTLLQATSPGVFTIAGSFGATPNPITAIPGDFNGDGKPDALIGFQNGSFGVVLGVGNGTFNAGSSFASPLHIIGDWNGDGKLDVAGADITTTDMAAGRFEYVVLGAGNGTFTTPGAMPLVGSGPAASAAGDFNNDHKLDIAVADLDGNAATVVAGNGNGNFGNAIQLITGSEPNGIVAADFNCDGNLDVAVTNGNGTTVSVFAGHGDLTFDTQLPFNAGAGEHAPVVADFNEDGAPDIMLTNYTLDTLTLLTNNKP